MTNWVEKNKRLDYLWANGGWLYRIAVLVSVGVGIWAAGLFWKWPQGFFELQHFARLDDFLELCANPLSRNLHEPILGYRLTTPILAFLLNLSPGASAMIAWVALGLSYAVCWLALRKSTDSIYALIIVFSLSQSFFAHTSIRWLGIPDSVTLLALAGCLFKARSSINAFLTIVGIMNDERFLMAIPSLIIWKIVVLDCQEEKSGLVRNTKDLTNEIISLFIGLVIGILVAFLIRHGLAVGWIGEGIQKPEIYKTMGDQVLLKSHWRPYGSTWPIFIFNIIFSWSWMWFYFGVLIFKSKSSYQKLLKTFSCFYLSLAILSTSLVIDVSRSMSFLFPIFLSGSICMYRQFSEKKMKYAFILALLMALTPGVYYGAYGSGAVFIPYPIDLINMLIEKMAGIDLLQILKKIFTIQVQR